VRHVERVPDRRYGIVMDRAATVQPSRFARLSGRLRGVLRRSLDVALPPLCPSCRDLVTDSGLCPACWSKLAFISAPYCPRLGIPFAYDPGPGILSMQAIADPPAYNRARAAVRYDDVARKLVHGLKYGDRMDLVPMIGRWMIRAGHELLGDADALVPVPLHWRRRWQRGYNQAEVLARAIGRETRTPVHRLLRRIRNTPYQSAHTPAERRASVRGAFASAGKVNLTGKVVLLIDDVLTTVATQTRPRVS